MFVGSLGWCERYTNEKDENDAIALFGLTVGTNKKWQNCKSKLQKKIKTEKPIIVLVQIETME